MGNIGGPEILVVLIIALLVLGPNRLPQAARQMGKAMAEFRKITGGLQAEVRDAMSNLEHEVTGAGDPQPPKPPPALVPSPPPTYEFPATTQPDSEPERWPESQPDVLADAQPEMLAEPEVQPESEPKTPPSETV